MKVAILGTVGVPGRYGGFETLAENLVRHHHAHSSPIALTVYCSAAAYPDRPATFLSAKLRYSRLKANGAQSVAYDALTMINAVWHRHDVILLLGVSGAVVLPFIRLVSRARIITNVDGIEWRRAKWRGVARWFLRWSERLAMRWSHGVIADNQAIADYLVTRYGATPHLIEYGGDHAVIAPETAPGVKLPDLPASYALALCRIEPENNVDMILKAFADAALPLVFVGNWNNSAYGRALRQTYSNQACLTLLDPIFDPAVLHDIRSRATVYIHGHSAGGTNPALVEMMHFAHPILAYDCPFNRLTTQGAATYFDSAQTLTFQAEHIQSEPDKSGAALRKIAQRRYTWSRICGLYFTLFSDVE